MSSVQPFRILGIDPGTASTGYGMIEARGQELSAVCGGVVTTAAGEPPERRLGRIFASLDELLERHRPEAVAVEEIFFGRNTRTAFAVGQARGVVLAVAGLRGICCFAYTPQAVKLSVCGAGQARKDQVQRMVTALLGLATVPETDHAADAFAVAICHAFRHRASPSLGAASTPTSVA
jgi:crossover junction endodeoxyribonuclease RuvC